jgi:hypothetical protein
MSINKEAAFSEWLPRYYNVSAMYYLKKGFSAAFDLQQAKITKLETALKVIMEECFDADRAAKIASAALKEIGAP